MRAVVSFSFVVCAACSSASALVDAGSDASADASDDGVLDAGTPRCAADGGGSSDPTALAAFGSFAGAASGDVCSSGAFAVIQTAATDAGSEALLVIQAADLGDSSSFFRFASPAQAVSGSLAIVVGLPSASAGTFSSDGACGDLRFCAVMPVPAVDCGDAAAPSSCPAGCDFVETGGPCAPAAPETCFVAAGTSDCSGDPTPPIGSWEMNLASVAHVDGSVELAAHGVFRAKLVGEGASAVTLTLGF